MEALSQNSTITVQPNDEDAARTAILGTVLEILSRIHAAFVMPADDPSQHIAVKAEDTALEDAKRRRMLHALLDLISLEGIYPSLSSGVGIPLQRRVISVLPAGVIARQADIPASDAPHNMALLHRCMKVLLGILLDSRPSIQPVIRGRILSDIISGTADLAYNPHIDIQGERAILRQQLATIVNEYVFVFPHIIWTRPY